MHRTTLMLPSDLKIRAQERARALGISLGEYVRRALESELEESRTDERAADALFSDDAVFDGQGPADLAAEHDRYLYGEQAG